MDSPHKASRGENCSIFWRHYDLRYKLQRQPHCWGQAEEITVENVHILTNLSNKMASILTDDIFTWIFLKENSRIPIQSLLIFVPKIPTDNKPVFVQVMALRRTGGTRQQSAQILYEYPTRTDIGRKCIRHLLPEIVNKTQSCITEKVSTHSLNGFSTYIKKHMISNYSEHGHIENCYICHKQNWASFQWLFFNILHEPRPNDHDLVNSCVHCPFFSFFPLIVVYAISLNHYN